MHREQFLNLLGKYVVTFPEDKDNKEKIEKFVLENENCFERSCIPGHITGSSWIIDMTRSFTLLTHHKKLDAWLQLGGHADGLVDVRLVALKEAQEESGLTDIQCLSDAIFDIDIHLIPGKEGSHFHYDVRFLFQADPSAKLLISHESKDLAWIRLDQLEEFSTKRSVLRMRDKTRLFPHYADSSTA